MMELNLKVIYDMLLLPALDCHLQESLASVGSAFKSIHRRIQILCVTKISSLQEEWVENKLGIITELRGVGLRKLKNNVLYL